MLTIIICEVFLGLVYTDKKMKIIWWNLLLLSECGSECHRNFILVNHDSFITLNTTRKNKKITNCSNSNAICALKWMITIFSVYLMTSRLNWGSSLPKPKYQKLRSRPVFSHIPSWHITCSLDRQRMKNGPISPPCFES